MGGRMPDFFDAVLPQIELTIEALDRKKFRLDPIGGDRFSRMTSIISSAYKRHGKIIESAIRERLKEHDEYDVWDEPGFTISQAADHLSQRAANCIGATLPYGEEFRKVQVDLIVFDKVRQTLRSYEVKRGNGHFDAGKKRSLMRDLLSTHVLLKSYGESRDYTVSDAEAKIIFYYGLRSIPRPFSLVGDELDDHFRFDLCAGV